VPKISDKAYLLRDQYRNASNLNARVQLHTRFSTNKYPWYRWVFDQLKGPSNSHLLEIGCGPGNFWLENLDCIPDGWTMTLSDFSPGMLQEARQKLDGHTDRLKFELADAQSLLFDNASFDIVMANHMLYHVPDRPKAYAEICRVLKANGRFYAATNGQNHMQELRQLIQQTSPAMASSYMSPHHFTLEKGAEELSDWFSNVTTIICPMKAWEPQLLSWHNSNITITELITTEGHRYQHEAGKISAQRDL